MRYLIFVILLFTIQSGLSQQLDKKFVDGWLSKCDSSLTANKIDSYVINGMRYTIKDSLKVDSALHRLTNKSLLAIKYLKIEDIIPQLNGTGGLMVIVLQKGSQSRRQKRELLKTAKAFYSNPFIYKNHIILDSKEPVLSIDDTLIFHSDCYSRLMKIKLSSVYAISIVKQPVPWEYYGQHAKNGLIKIYTSH